MSLNDKMLDAGIGSSSRNIIPQHNGASEVSENPLDNANQKPHKRHTKEQLYQLESLYEKIQHPDDMQRLDLANAIGLEPQQVKFWFQIKRIHMKVKETQAHASKKSVGLRTPWDF